MIKNIYLNLEKFLVNRKHKRDILILVHNDVMFSYVKLIYTRLKLDKRLRLWFCFIRPEKISKEKRTLYKKEYNLKTIPYRIACYLPWDLILYPDHGPFFRKICRKFYVGHGVGEGKLVNNESYMFASKSKYEDGSFLYDKIFYPSEFGKDLVEECYPEFAGRVKAVGSLMAEKLISYFKDRKSILKETGLDSSKRTVMIVSTWGEKSLIQKEGNALIKQLKHLKEKFNFIISIHPNNVVDEYSGGTDWKQVMSEVKCENIFWVKGAKPFPYLVCSDCLLTDFTGVRMYYSILNKPLIYWCDSDIKYGAASLFPRLEEASYIIDDISGLDNHIESSFIKFSESAMKDVSSKIFSYLDKSWLRYKEEIYETLGLSI